MTLHYIKLHYIPLLCIILCDIALHNIILHFSCTVVALKSQNQISPGVVWCGGVVWFSTDNNTTLGLYWGYPRLWQL